MAGLERLIKSMKADVTCPWSSGAHSSLVHFDSLDRAKPNEFVENESVAASDVEDPSRGSAREKTADRIQDERFPRSPPPMPAVEQSVPEAVLRMQFAPGPPFWKQCTGVVPWSPRRPVPDT